MPTTTPINNIWRYQMNLERAGQKAIIGIVLRNVGTVANTDYFNFCNSILVGAEQPGKIFAETAKLLTVDWKINSHRLQAISPARLVPLIRQPGGAPTPGTSIGVSLPINTQVAIARKTAVATRWGLSILKPPFGSASDTTDKANWNAAFLTAVGAWATLSMANFVGSTPGDILQPVVWSSGEAADALEFYTYTVNPYLRVMRRRTVGLGK